MSEVCSSVGSSQQDLEEEAIVQLAIDLRKSYNDIDVSIKPTQISLAVLLKLAAVLRKVPQKAESDRGDNTKHQIDKREERRNRRKARRAKYRLMVSQSSQLVKPAVQYPQRSRVASVKPANECGSKAKGVDNSKKAAHLLATKRSKPRSDSPGCDSEIRRITSQIIDGHFTPNNRDTDGRSSQLSTASSSCRCFDLQYNRKKKPQSWHNENFYSASANEKTTSFPDLDITDASVGKGNLSDTDAQMISEPYRLMTKTHERLSSVSPPTNRRSSSLPQANKKPQPVLGLTQRRRRQEELRRKTVHGVTFTQTEKLRDHTRRHSDTRLPDTELIRPLEQKLRFSSYLHMIDIDNDASVKSANQQQLYPSCRSPVAKSHEKLSALSPTKPAAAAQAYLDLLSYEHRGVTSLQDKSYVYQHKLERGAYIDDYRVPSDVYGRDGMLNYRVRLTSAEQAIEEIWKHESALTPNSKPVDWNNNTGVASTNTLTSSSYRHTPSNSALPPPHRFASYRDTSIDVRAQTGHVSRENKPSVKPVKRTASMPAKAFSPENRRQHVTVDRDTPMRAYREVKQLPNSSSQRPGRGVFADSGRRIQERQIQTNDRPPRLPARGAYGNGRSVSTGRAEQSEPGDRVDSDEVELPNSWARRHKGNPDWSYSSSESSPKPIDQLRNRVRLQQEKERQRNIQMSQKQMIQNPKQAQHSPQLSHQMSHHNDDHDETDFGFDKHSAQQLVSHTIGPSKIGRRSRKDQHLETGYDAPSLSYAPQPATRQHMEQQPYLSKSNEHQTVQFRSRAISPTHDKRHQPSNRQNGVLHHAVPLSSRSISPDKTRVPASQEASQHQPSAGLEFRTRTISPERNRESREDSASHSVPKYSANHSPYSRDQQTEKLNHSATASFHHGKPKFVINGVDYPKHAASNKYKMLVCPDFFPVAKLNGLPKRQSRIDVPLADEIFADAKPVNSPVGYSTNQELEGFYQQRTNNMKPAPPQIPMDDSFVEDPREQLLYPTNKQAGRGRPLLKDSPNFYFEVSPTRNSHGASNSTSGVPDGGVFSTVQASSPQLATEGDSLFSVHTSPRSPENGIHLPTGEGSETSAPLPSNKRCSSPPPYQQAIHQTRSTKRYVEQMKPNAGSAGQRVPPEEYLEYQQTNMFGQQGRTAKVLAHIEPKEHEEMSHYSTISVYRNMSTKQANRPKPVSVKPAWNHMTTSGEPKRPHTHISNETSKNLTRSHSTERSFGKSTGSSAPVVSPRMRNLKTKPNISANSTTPPPKANIPPQPSHISRHLRDHSANRDDKLLEHIKAQYSQPPSNFVVIQRQTKEHTYQRVPVEENHYENLPSVVKSVEQMKMTESRKQRPKNTLNAVANPDYMYIPKIQQPQHGISEKLSKSVLSKPGSTSSTSTENSPNQLPRTFQTMDKPAASYHQQQRATVSAENNHQPRLTVLPDRQGAAESYQHPDSVSLSHSSTTGSVSDGSHGLRKEADFSKLTKANSVADEEETFLSDDNNSNSVEVLPDTVQTAALRVHEESVPYTEKGQLSSVSDNGSVMSEDQHREQFAQNEEHATAKKADSQTASNGSISRGKGLGDDILSITKMWKNLPTDDSWDAKRKALLNDPIMSAISEKMEAILQTSADKEEIADKGKTTLSVRNEALTDHGLVSPQSPSDVGLVTREPGEGSSDDLDESIDLSVRKSNRAQPSQLSQPADKTSQMHALPASTSQSRLIKQNGQAMQRSGIPVRTKTNLLQTAPKSQRETAQDNRRDERDSKQREDNSIGFDGVVEVKQVRIVEPNSDEDNDGDDELSADLFKIRRQPSSSAKRESEMLDTKKPRSDSEESDGDEDFSLQGAPADHQEESDESDQEVPSEGVKYLSDYHRLKSKPKSRSPSKKKISFSTDAQRSRPGDLLTSNNTESLLSVNPFMTSSPTLEKHSNVLLSMDPFMTNVEPGEGSVGASPDSETDHSPGRKPRQGILKRSDEGAGSQISLGTCSEFGSHISLASADSGMSRAGSFPLLTMSDGSKKDFKITFNDTDTSDMSNLFKVVRKARSEGAASEPESTDSESDDDAMPVMCKNCRSKQPLFKARLVYKMCHGCYTYYCSSECRRQDWPAHKPLCIVSRLSSLARKIFKCVVTDQEMLHHCSRFARTGYLCEGRGAVVLSFSSPRKAQLFLSNAKQAKESALYLCVKDLQRFSFDDKRDKDQLISNCKHYNPDEKFVLHLAIKMNKSLSGQTVEPRIRGREFHKWARIRLSEKHNVPKGDRFNEEDTLILTALSTTPDQSTVDPPDSKTREVFFATVLTKLRKRGISLRHQYPDVYNALCQYVTSGKTFAPISLFAFNLNTQKRFMCCIMPYSDPDVTWGNNPHLMEDLDLAVTL